MRQKKIYRPNERAEIYKKSKIVLSIAFDDRYSECSNASRIFPAVSTKAFVVAERSKDDDQNRILDKICVNVPTEKLLHTIDTFLSFDCVRECVRQQFYNNIKSLVTDLPVFP